MAKCNCLKCRGLAPATQITISETKEKALSLDKIVKSTEPKVLDKVVENNKLIAEFIGGMRSPHPAPGFSNLGYLFPNTRWFGDQALRYHSSFNWMMQVVEYIEQMDFGFKMCRKVVEVYIDSTKETIIKVKLENRKESLYEAILQFIQYYSNYKAQKS